MRGSYRRKNRGKGGQQEVTFKQERFDAGYIYDLPASDLPKDSMALLENFNAYPEYLEGRSGTQLYSATSLPGSGTIHALRQHPTSQKWVLHRGSRAYYADAAQSSWTELLFHGSVNPTIVEAGDTSNQLASTFVTGTNSSNTNSNVLYWSLTNSVSVRTLNIYKDAAKLNLVLSGTRTGDGYMNLAQQNNSGLSGGTTVTYTGNDTDVGNTFTVTPYDYLDTDCDSTIKPMGNDFLLFIQSKQPPSGGQTCNQVYIDLTNFKLIAVAASGTFGYGIYSITGSGSQSASTPYGYRYVYSFSRIVNATTSALDSTLNRITGRLVFEGPSDSVNPLYSNSDKDYGEYWKANAITASNSNTVTVTVDGTTSNANLAYFAATHYTHISLYRTMDIGAAGVDPVTGSGNNRELYVWVGDFDRSLAQVTDVKSDDDIRAAFSAGFGLKTRFWVDMPIGEIGEITNSFMYSAKRGQNTVSYGQLTNKAYLGYYQAAYQYFKLDDGAQVFSRSPDMISFLCANSTYISSPNSYTDAGGSGSGPIYVLNHLTKASANIGCSDYGSLAQVDSANQLGQFGEGGSTAFIARCSDNTIRIWNNSSWSNDLSSRRVNKVVQTMLTGSVGAYWRGVYKLYYRTSSGSSNTTALLRFGMSTDGGFGWSQETGSALPLPQTYIGAGSFMDANGIQRMYCLDASDGLFYWVETFTAYSGASLTKVFLDKVAVNGSGGTAFTCKARFREVTGPSEGMNLAHKEAYIYDRPYDESAGFITGFSRNYLTYVDGSSTATGSLTGAARGADLQFFETVAGSRIQPEVQFTRSGARLTGFEALFDAQDKAAIGNGPGAYTEATNQAALAQNMKVWLTRPSNLLNRASGSSFTLTGTAPTNVSGPDGKTYGLSFVTGASYSIAETTSYSDFSLHFWVKSATTTNRILQLTGTNSFYVTFASNTSLSINGAGSLTVSTIVSGWHDFWIVRSGSTVTAYQNGAVVSGTVSVSTARGGTTFDLNPDAAAMILYDIRAYNTVLSAADVAYYYASVTTTNGGSKVLPLG